MKPSKMAGQNTPARLQMPAEVPPISGRPSRTPTDQDINDVTATVRLVALIGQRDEETAAGNTLLTMAEGWNGAPADINS